MSASDPSVSIIVPTRNEAENIAPLVSQIVAAAVPFHEIIFVDDHSADGTPDVIRSLAAIHPIHPRPFDECPKQVRALFPQVRRMALAERLCSRPCGNHLAIPAQMRGRIFGLAFRDLKFQFRDDSTICAPPTPLPLRWLASLGRVAHKGCLYRRRTTQAQIAPAAKKMLFRCRLK